MTLTQLKQLEANTDESRGTNSHELLDIELGEEEDNTNNHHILFFSFDLIYSCLLIHHEMSLIPFTLLGHLTGLVCSGPVHNRSTKPLVHPDETMGFERLAIERVVKNSFTFKTILNKKMRSITK